MDARTFRGAAAFRLFQYFVLALALLSASVDVGLASHGQVRALVLGQSLGVASADGGSAEPAELHRRSSFRVYCAESDVELSDTEGCDAQPLSLVDALGAETCRFELCAAPGQSAQGWCTEAQVDTSSFWVGARLPRGPPSIG